MSIGDVALGLALFYGEDEKGIAPADTLRGTQSMLIINRRDGIAANWGELSCGETDDED